MPNDRSAAVVVIHPSTRVGYAKERLRKAAEMTDAERRKFLTEALAKYRTWARGLGVEPYRIEADVAILTSELFPDPQRRRG